MLVVKATCPHCGAPLGLEEGQRHLVCAYCDTSLAVQPSASHAPPGGPAGLAPTLTETAVPEGVVREVKALVLAGKPTEAIAVYAKAAGLSHEEAEAAVKQLVQLDLLRLLRSAPIGAAGFLFAFVPMGLAAFGLAHGISNGMEGELGYLALAALSLVVILERIRWLVPKAISTVVAAAGAEGRARVVKRVVMQSEYVKGGALVLLLFEVTPGGGGAPFHDEEVLLVRSESLEKLEPGNVIRVRYSSGRGRVFPVSPIEVVGRA